MAKNNATGILVNIALVLLIIYLFSITQKFLGPVYDIFIFLATPLILSIYLFYAFRPVRDWLAKKTKRPDLSAVLTFLLFIACTIGLFTVTISMIYNQAQSFVSNLDMQALIRYSDTEIFQQINRYVPLNRYIAQFESWLQSSASNIPNVLGGLLSNIGTFGSLILLILLGLFYLLKDEEQAVATIHYLARGKYYSRIMDILGQIHRTLETYISGQILVAGILGVLMFIGYTIIGLPYKLSLAAIALIFNFIPFIGPFLGAAPAVLVALTIDFAMVVKVIVVSTIVQQLEGNVITPNIMGSRLDIHPFVVIIAVMVCANLFGVLGALIASPLYMVLKIIIHGIRAERYHKGAQCPIPEEGSPNANDL
ncbi:pheromone autoinducer 2 transporter [Aedoeadaptatus ivorii]|uniref:Pheromone autoinducer 2 transporter n=1 Tax=Aedoeadaptatus ivorii TaxID=54006 RepID=A0A448V312_9FIRM|nr:AI-2E family transporter [Peptoniphilus ivorii]MDQ0508677.1 putative PurR-regulated permease PerM [Peptoniphilus ivorii]VEJ36196.1 pheromone autoinducer 2 transporter [Peptoniphilus ivorii]